MKFTFKKHSEPYYPDYFDIKFKKKICGSITTNSFSDKYSIRLMIEKDDTHNDNNKNCSWLWITIKKSHLNTPDECKKWLNENIDMLMKKYTIHMCEE